MKKILIFGFVLLMFSSFVSAQYDIIQENSTLTSTNDFGTVNDCELAGTFKAPFDFNLTRVQLWSKIRDGTPTGSYFIVILNTNDGSPVYNSNLSMSDLHIPNESVSHPAAPSPVNYTFNTSNTVTLLNNTKYTIAIRRGTFKGGSCTDVDYMRFSTTPSAPKIYLNVTKNADQDLYKPKHYDQTLTHIIYGIATGSTPPEADPQLPGQHTVFPGVIDYLSTTPNNNTQWNYPSKNFSTTVNSTLPFNCTLYLNNTINTSFSNSINGTNKLFNINLTFPTIETTISHFWSCIDNSTTIFNSTDVPAVSFIDMLPPQTNISGFVNGTNGFISNITAQFNFTDGFMLHSYNVSVDGVQLAYKSAIGDTYANYNLSINPQAYSVGLHTITTRWADGHTSEELGGDYEVSTGFFDSYLEYGFYDEGGVTIDTSPSSIFDEFSTTKETDRYKFVYEPFDDSKSEYTFTVESDLYIDIYPDAAVYDDYLIIGNHWLDFRLESEPYAEVTITRIGDYEVSVNISNIQNPSIMAFNSIGDLNIVEKNYTFSSTNATVAYSEYVQELEKQYHALRINITSGMFGTNAFFYYNNSNYSFTKTAHTGYDLYNSTFITPGLIGSALSETRSFTWVSEVIGINNETYNLTNTQSIFKLGIDNCSSFNVTAVNFTLYDEFSEVNVNGTLNGYFQTWISDINYFATFNLTWGTQPKKSMGLCIFPGYAKYITYAQMVYGKEGFADKTYYFVNTTLSNDTQYVKLWLNNETTIVSLKVKDQNGDPIDNAYIKILTYDVPTNSYHISEIVKTGGGTGTALSQMVLNTVWYKFIIEIGGRAYLETAPGKITTTSKEFSIDLTEDYFLRFDDVRQISHSLTYTNSTKNFAFTFSDPTGTVHKACLEVKRRSVYGDTFVNNSCSTSSAATLLVNIGSPEQETYIANTYIILDERHDLDTMSVGYADVYKTYGAEGLFVSFFLILALILVGIWSPMVAVVMGLLGLIVVNIIGFSFLSWHILIAVIITGGITIYKLSK